MDYTQIMSEIKKGRIRPVYLLHGEESFLAGQVEKALIEAALPAEERDMGLTVFERDPSVPELINAVETIPFMGGSGLVVVKGTQLFRAGRKAGGEGEAQGGADERLIKLLENMPDYNRLVFVAAEAADKRRKLYKCVERVGAAVEFSPLKPRDVRPWLSARLAETGKKMAPDALEHFLAAVSLMPQVSLGFVANELEKFALYAAGPAITRRDVEAVMSGLPEISVFAMVEAVSQKQAARALKLLEEQLAAGENVLRLLALMSRQVRQLWQGRELALKGLGSAAIAAELGVPPFVGEKLARQIGRAHV